MKISNPDLRTQASPIQWQGTVDGNRPVYVRYWWGYLSVRVGPPDGDEASAVSGRVVYGQQIGEEFDGVIKWKTVRDLIKPLNLLKILTGFEASSEDR